MNQHILYFCQVALALRLGQDTQADLHSLHIVTVNAHGHSLSFLELVLFEQSTDDENSINTHLLVSEAEVALRFYRQLCESHS